LTQAESSAAQLYGGYVADQSVAGRTTDTFTAFIGGVEFGVAVMRGIIKCAAR